MGDVDFSRFSTQDLMTMVKQMNDDNGVLNVPEDALLRQTARQVFNVDEVNVMQMLSLAIPIALELVTRIENGTV